MSQVSKILVVDDEPDLQVLVKQRFRKRIRSGELEFRFALDGVEALDVLKAEPDVDMVLSDINMPRMDGLTLLGRLSELAPLVKAVIVSAYGDMGNIRTAMNRGAFDFLTKPIDFDDLDITIDKTLMHLAQLRDALQSKDQLVAIRQELDLARRLQKAILPARFPETGPYQLFADMSPAREVGGDFYDFFVLDDGRLAIAIADVSGKGMVAALFMTMSRALLRASAASDPSPGRCLARVNRLLCTDNPTAMFVTLFYGVLDPASGELVHANAGHAPPYRIGRDGVPRPLERAGAMALGVVEGLDYAEASVRLAPGDKLFLFTDGVTEAFDPAGNEFGAERLEALLGEPAADARSLLERVAAAVKAFAGAAEQADDLTCLALRYDGAGAGEAAAPARRVTITVANRLDEIARVASGVEAFVESHRLPERLAGDFDLALDELLTNLISYGYDDERPHEIVVHLQLEDGRLVAELEDDARPFNPLEAPPPDLDAPLAERKIGGLGIHLVKSLMDKVEYRSEGGRNRLVMVKAVGAGG